MNWFWVILSVLVGIYSIGFLFVFIKTKDFRFAIRWPFFLVFMFIFRGGSL